MDAAHPFFRSDRPMVIAHRGGSALAPENTHAAFDRAATLGVDAIELDVHLSHDGHVVVSHDPTVDRTTNGSGAIAALSLEALRAFDAGHAFTPDAGATWPYRGKGLTLPVLDEVLRRHADLRFSIEIKTGTVEAARAVQRIVAAAGAEPRVCVGSFQDAPMHWLRREAPGIATHATAAEVKRFAVLRPLGLGFLVRPKADVFTVPETSDGRRVVSPRFVRALARRGRDVHVWNVYEVDAMRRLLGWGVRGIVTARPDLALDVVRG